MGSQRKIKCHQKRVEWTVGRPGSPRSLPPCHLTYSNAGYLGPGEAFGSVVSLCISMLPLSHLQPYRVICVCACLSPRSPASSRVKAYIYNTFCSALGLLISSLGYKAVDISMPLYLCSSESRLPSLPDTQIWGPHEDFTLESYPATCRNLGAAKQRLGEPCVPGFGAHTDAGAMTSRHAVALPRLVTYLTHHLSIGPFCAHFQWASVRGAVTPAFWTGAGASTHKLLLTEP